MENLAASLFSLCLLLINPVPLMAESRMPCEREELPGDLHEFRCPLKTFSTAQKFRFSVILTGGHDDSSSVLSARNEGGAIRCDEESKTASDGEYGDVILDCRFTLPAPFLLAPSTLLVTLKATHVRFEEYSLATE